MCACGREVRWGAKRVGGLLRKLMFNMNRTFAQNRISSLQNESIKNSRSTISNNVNTTKIIEKKKKKKKKKV